MARLSRPLVVACFAFLLGLVPALRFAPPVLPLLVLAGFCLLFFVFLPRTDPPSERSALPYLAILGSLAFTGAALGAGARAEVGADCRSWIPDNTELTVRGVLAASSIPLDRDSLVRPPLLPLLATDIRGARAVTSGCRGEIRVRIPEGEDPLLAGSELELEGRWVRFSEPVVRSAWPRDPRYQGFLAVDEVIRAEPPRLDLHPLLTLRGRSEQHLRRIFPEHGALAEALLLGRREYVDSALRERFTQAGLAHLLAISGMHVGLIAGILLLVGGTLPVSRRRTAWVVIGCIMLYLAMIGAPASAVRAGVMISLALLGIVLQRPFAALPIIAAAAFVILVEHPTAVLEPGFQLSFAGVLGILMLRAAVLRQLPLDLRHTSKWRRWTIEAVIVGAAAFVATAPITAWHFGTVAPIALVANLPAVPLMSLALVGVLLAAVAEPLISPVGLLFAHGAGLALDLLDWVAGIAAAVPYGHASVPRPQAWLWAGAAVVLLLTLDAAGKLRPRIRWTVAGFVTAAFVLVWPVAGAANGAALELHFLDVGQGDAVAIRTPGDRWLLIDAGPRIEDYDVGERRVLPFLRAYGVTRLAAVILTHPDADHMGGLPAVLRGIDVGRLVDPGLAVGKPMYLELLRTAQEEGVEWAAAHSGRVLQLDGVTLEVLWPDKEMLDRAVEANEISVVLRIHYEDFTALLMGDAPSVVEEQLVDRHGPELRADILKIGHHGSYTSTSGRLLDAVQPELAVISVGRGNRYGHPAPDVVQRLQERGIVIARTDREGTVSIRVEPRTSPDWRRLHP